MKVQNRNITSLGIIHSLLLCHKHNALQSLIRPCTWMCFIHRLSVPDNFLNLTPKSICPESVSIPLIPLDKQINYSMKHYYLMWKSLITLKTFKIVTICHLHTSNSFRFVQCLVYKVNFFVIVDFRFQIGQFLYDNKICTLVKGCLLVPEMVNFLRILISIV